MTANVSSSSATGRLELDLLDPSVRGHLPPVPAAMLRGEAPDLVAPLRFLLPGEVPQGAPPTVDRSVLAAALRRANHEYGHPRAGELADRLADPTARVVVTGQQPGLYGGPLLGLTKLAAAVRWADALESAGEPAVAVFWVATEDHDWAELSRGALLTRDGPWSFDLGPDRSPLRPVGARALEGIAELGGRLREALDSELAVERFGLAERFYRPEARFGDAFCRFLVHLLGARAPLFLDAGLAELKELQRPWLERLVDHAGEADATLRRREAEIEGRGLPLQVRPQPGATELFLLRDDERRRIVRHGEDAYVLRGREDRPEPLDRLRAILAAEPWRVSPGVLARPAIQDAVLGTSLLILGPAEMSYLAQAAALYEVLEVPAPSTVLRPQALMLDERPIRHLEELDVSLAELLATPVDRLLADKLGADVVAPARGRLSGTLEELRESLVAIEPQLEAPWRKTRDQVDRALDLLSAKVAAAVARRHETASRRLGQARDLCLPAGILQERHLSLIHYLTRYGPSFAEVFWEQLDLDPRRLQVLRPGLGSEKGS